MKKRAVAELAASSFVLGSVTTYLLMYSWHQRTLKFIGVAYGIAHDEIEELKKDKDE